MDYVCICTVDTKRKNQWSPPGKRCHPAPRRLSPEDTWHRPGNLKAKYNPGSATNKLCGLEQVSSPLLPSVSSRVPQVLLGHWVT